MLELPSFDAEEALQRRRHQAAYLSRYGSTPERAWRDVPVVDFVRAYEEMNDIVGRESGETS